MKIYKIFFIITTFLVFLGCSEESKQNSYLFSGIDLDEDISNDYKSFIGFALFTGSDYVQGDMIGIELGICFKERPEEFKLIIDNIEYISDSSEFSFSDGGNYEDFKWEIWKGYNCGNGQTIDFQSGEHTDIVMVTNGDSIYYEMQIPNFAELRSSEFSVDEDFSINWDIENNSDMQFIDFCLIDHVMDTKVSVEEYIDPKLREYIIPKSEFININVVEDAPFIRIDETNFAIVDSTLLVMNAERILGRNNKNNRTFNKIIKALSK